MYYEALAAGAGGDWWHVIILQAPLGATINVTDGDEDIDTVGTGNPMAIPVHNENSTYDITINATGFQWTDQFNTTSVSGGYEFIDIDYGTIELTFDDDFRGLDLTVTDSGSNTGTVEAPSTGNTMTIYVPALGTWKVGSEISGYTYWTKDIVISDFNIPKQGALLMVPVGATVTPTDDIQTWLLCAGIRDRGTYTTLSEVLADEQALIEVLTDDNATDYLKRSVTWAVGITGNEEAMSYIGAYDYAADTLLSDATWRAAILSSAYVSHIYDGHVPIMTSNTTPYGVAFANSEASESWAAWMAFDDISADTRWCTAAGAGTNGYIGYKFPEPICVEQIYYKQKNSVVPGTFQNVTAYLEYSDDGVNYTALSPSISILAAQDENTVNFNNTVYAQYWRLKFNSGNYYANNSYYATLTKLQFLGREIGTVQSWLKAANISLPYIEIDEVLNDHVTLAKLMTNHDAVDYLAEAKALIDPIVSSETAMRYIGKRNYASNKLLADADWCFAIFNSNNRSLVLNVEVPVLSADTDACIASSTYPPSGSTYYYKWYAFDNNNNTFWAKAAADNNGYIGYDFGKPVRIVIAGLKQRSGGNIAQYVQVKATNNSTWEDVSSVMDADVSGNMKYQVVPFSENAYDKWALFGSGLNSSNYWNVVEAKLFGREDVDESKVILRGASGANIYYKNAGIDVPITTLVGTEAEVLRSNLPSGKATLYSDVADDPDNIGNDFHKDVVIDANTIEIDVMPDDAIYWYGFEGEDFELTNTANGWTLPSGYTFINPTKQTSYIDLSTASGSGSKLCGIGSGAKKTGLTGVINRGDISVSSYYGGLIASKNKIPSNLNTVTFQRLTNSVKATNKDYGSIMGENSYKATATYNGQRNIVTALWQILHNPAANFFSAANDLVYYMSGGVQVPFAVTNELGEAVVDFSEIPNGTYQLYSSVGKDPTDSTLTRAFTKEITVKSDMRYEKFYMMPDGALYWFGCNETPLGGVEPMLPGTGWSYGTYTFILPTHYERSVYLLNANTGSNTYALGVGARKVIDGSVWPTYKAILSDVVYSAGAGVVFGSLTQKTPNTSPSWAGMINVPSHTGMFIANPSDISSRTANYLICFVTGDATRRGTINALWCEKTS